MANKEITNEELAHMVARGFENTVTKGDIVNMATKDDIGRIDERLDRIENLLIRDSFNRIERLEDSMRQVKTKLAL